ncbi:hypothetical protein FSP39_015470 [Pinctada imbricata]|uniref:CCDC66 domain-containing protein n=1 Tax=Pinctada imbricata TaxID=66713 RepID=A0AA89C7R3_PINIB|nr:hypothetical protein FSP39_015470 [Pinctada imbricata]
MILLKEIGNSGDSNENFWKLPVIINLKLRWNYMLPLFYQIYMCIVDLLPKIFPNVESLPNSTGPDPIPKLLRKIIDILGLVFETNQNPIKLKAVDKPQNKNKDFKYKGRDQQYRIRNHPRNLDRISPERDNILKPIAQNGVMEDDTEEKPKKPQKNFIQRNRDKAGLKQAKGKKSAKKEDPNDKTVTLTQEQLNAILASVGQVASGEEDKLKISIDEGNGITIESPRRNDEDDRDRHGKNDRKTTKSRKGKKEEDSIYSLLQKDTHRSHRDEDERISDRREKKHVEREDTDDVLLRKLKERFAPELDKKSREHESRGRYSPDRDRDDSVERSRKSRRDKGKSRERYRDDSRDRYDDNDRGSRDRYRNEDKGSRERHKKERDVKNEIDIKTVTAKQPDVLTPRDVVGVPLGLSWKHMTVAERRRLMLARDKAQVEEEKREGEAVKAKWSELQQKDSGDNRDKHRKSKPSRSRERSLERTPESDISRDRYDRREKSRDRHDRSRDRRDRSRDRGDRSRDRHYRRSRTPSPADDDHRTTDSFPLSDSKSLPTLTFAEKKKLQWERERAESAAREAGYHPWGKPGAGAPLRTRSGKVAADYKSRQDGSYSPIEEEENEEHRSKQEKKREEEPRRKSDQSRKRKHERAEHAQQDGSNVIMQSQSHVPAAMRSSFVFGGLAPSTDIQENIKEEERKQWIKELDRQREEKRIAQMKELETNRGQPSTWADKFSKDHKPLGLPEQPRIQDKEDIVDTGRVSSAPGAVQNPDDDDDERSYIRGQNVFIDPVTRKELEEKRQRQMEHQKAIMEQVQERQRQKQQEKERKMREDMEEENKLKAERERLQRQQEIEMNKVKMKEMKRQEEVEKLKATMDEAHEQALREKYNRKMQHLEQGGHDVSHLKANLAAKLTPREEANYVEPTHVPGLNLDLSPRAVPMVTTGHMTQKDMVMEPLYTENRVLTPSRYRRSQGSSPKREFGTQTGMKHDANVNPELGDDESLEKQVASLVQGREVTDIGIMYKIVNGKRVRVKSAPKEERQSYTNRTDATRDEHAFKKKRPEKLPIKGRKKWNFQNKELKRPVKQSERDPFYEKRQKERIQRQEKRKQELLQLVEKNLDRIPTERPNRTPGSSRSHSPMSEGGRTPRSVNRQPSTRRTKSHSPDLRGDTRLLDRSLSPVHRSQSPPASHRSITPQIFSQRGRSPPIPALRHRHYNEGPDVLKVEHNALVPVTRISNTKYGDTDPLEIPVGNSDFVPFTRTIDILDPALATQPMPVSREATQVENARKAYIKGMKPGNYGNRVDMYQDRMRMPNETRVKDPILNPSLVKDHPTHRQDMILQQLSSLKEHGPDMHVSGTKPSSVILSLNNVIWPKSDFTCFRKLCFSIFTGDFTCFRKLCFSIFTGDFTCFRKLCFSIFTGDFTCYRKLCFSIFTGDFTCFRKLCFSIFTGDFTCFRKLCFSIFTGDFTCFRKLCFSIFTGDFTCFRKLCFSIFTGDFTCFRKLCFSIFTGDFTCFRKLCFSIFTGDFTCFRKLCFSIFTGDFTCFRKLCFSIFTGDFTCYRKLCFSIFTGDFTCFRKLCFSIFTGDFTCYRKLCFSIFTGDFTCFRKFRTKRGKEFCKGPVRKKNKYPNAEKCCAKRGKGFAMEISVLTGVTGVHVAPHVAPAGGHVIECVMTATKITLKTVQSEPCMQNFYCPVDGNWGPWFAWTPCSDSCGGGTRKRERRCNYPPPTHGGRDCPGDREKEESCNEEPCAVDGNWGPWTRYSQCSATCGTGTMVRTRDCDDPAPQYGGKNCRGQSIYTRRCKSRECPLHGGWSLWGSWSECSVTCDTGVVTRRRTCDSPRPLFGGRDCEGSDTDTRGCFTNKKCPVHGGWTKWSDYGRCNANRCEKGFQMRSRSCTNPRPRHRGRPCRGRSYERSECINDDNCPSESFEVRECKDVQPCNPYSEVISESK